MRIGKRGEAARGQDKPPSGPWSDLPPAASQRTSRRTVRRPPPRGSAREPLIRNWRGLLIVLFLLLVAPLLARWASAWILGLLPGR